MTIELVAAFGFFLLAAWVLGQNVIIWRQNVEKAVHRVRGQLHHRAFRGDGHAKVSLWTVRPLSPHMVKEIAKDEGFQYAGEGVAQGGIRSLDFVPPKKPKWKLSIDD